MLDGSLGFAAGVMLAASYWSLLAPAIDMAAESPTYGETFAFVPVAIGFFLGAVFVYGSDVFMSYAGVDSPVNILLNKRQEDNGNGSIADSNEGSFGSPSASIQMRKGISKLIGSLTWELKAFCSLNQRKANHCPA